MEDAPPSPVPTPTPTREISPPVRTVPADNLIVNEDPPRLGPFNTNTLAYGLPGMDQVEVINITYAFHGDRPLTMDIYYPPGTSEGTQLPVVVFGLGYRMSKLPLRNAHFYTSWGKLVAAAGMVGITYDTEQPDGDLEILIATIRENAAFLRIDPARIGFMSSSMNVPTVMSYLMQEERDNIRFSVYYYGFSLTPDHKYSEALAPNCLSGYCLYDELADIAYVDPEVPLFVVKAGRDKAASINEAMDHFVDFVEGAGAHVTLIHYADGVHGFDTEQKTDESAEIIAQTLAFMRANFGLE